jgi:small subunit ribosomal protein S26e
MEPYTRREVWDTTKKRVGGGRSKGNKGSSGTVQCSLCGAVVPSDKAKRQTRFTSLVDSRLLKELQQQGSSITSTKVTKINCISCAVHRGVVKVRGKDERREVIRRRRPSPI